MTTIAPQQCPRFESCSAPFCPLDKYREKRTMLRDERVCHYIRNIGKSDSYDDVEHDIANSVKELMVDASLEAAMTRALKRLGKPINHN